MGKRLDSSRIVTKLIPIDAIKDHPDNYNQHPDEQVTQLAASHEEFGQYRSILVWERPNGEYVRVVGHGYSKGAKQADETMLRAEVLPIDTPPDVVKAIMLADNLHAQNSSPDDEMLARLLQEQADAGYDLASLGTDDETLRQMLEALGDEYAGGGSQDEGDGGDEFDTTPQEGPTRTHVGEIWQLGKHRLLVGDSTKREDVARLMQGENVVLCHADPPYGMGKEKDGVANDNLYREKLDTFQMAWWQTCRSYLTDNASVYIWGNAEDLWRLWYAGGLERSERLTLRNEIVWDKANESGLYDGNGIGSSIARMYANLSERCLFFILGEQGFNTNTDNYWEGWEPIRLYLEQERLKMGWDIPTMKRVVGHSDLSRDHWTSKSQWNFPTRDVYEKMQSASQGKAFTRDYDKLKHDYDKLKHDYDKLKQEFYSTRAYFDNTHENMTDIWEYPRVKGEERYDHPTPKPVAMIERIVKTSSPDGSLVYEPFLGSGSTLIACERTGRTCFGCEIEPRFADVILRRYEAESGETAELLERVEEVSHA